MKNEKQFGFAKFSRWAALGAIITFVILATLIVVAALAPAPI